MIRQTSGRQRLLLGRESDTGFDASRARFEIDIKDAVEIGEIQDDRIAILQSAAQSPATPSAHRQQRDTDLVCASVTCLHLPSVLGSDHRQTP